MPVFLALLSSALWGTADFLGGTLTRRLSPFVVVGWSQAAGLVTAGLIVAVAPGDRPWTQVLPAACAAAVFGYGGLVAFYSALARGTMGVVAPITALGGVVPVAVGLLSGEKPSSVQMVGLLVALVGVVLASGPELSGRTGAAPIGLAVVAAACFGLTLTFIAAGAERDALATITVMRVITTGISAFALVVVIMRGVGAVARVDRRAVVALIAVGAFDVTANLTYAVASTLGLLTIVAVAGSLYPVATVILARVVHHERLMRVQQVGVGAALAGIALISGG
jgi:drug/metabolite transporter (DMT)-like permease